MTSSTQPEDGSVSKFSVSMPTDLLQALDERRGMVPRSRWIAEAVRVGLAIGDPK